MNRFVAHSFFAKLAIFFSLLISISACQEVFAQVSTRPNTGPGESYIMSQISIIASEKPSLSRTQRVEDLANWVNGENLNKVDKRDIEGLASMLNESDDSISFWVAIALSHIGQRAALAVPLLQQRLDYVSCIRTNGVAPEFSSAQAIHAAFLKIGAVPKAVVCR